MNSQDTLTRELALRIGLAARALPDTDAKTLFTVLTTAVGMPLTESKLASLHPQVLKLAFAEQNKYLEDGCCEQAVNILSQASENPSLAAQPYNEGDMPGSVRIACASSDGLKVDGHFGACAQFLVYQVSAEEARLIDIRNAELPDGLVVPDKNVHRAELIQDCQVLYVASVGGPAAAKIVRLGIHPMKIPDMETIASIIGQLQTVIAGTPPPWLAKAMGTENRQQLRFAQEAGG